MERVVLLAGGNIGDTTELLARAQTLIESQIGRVEHKSRVHKSKAWGFAAEREFANQAFEVATALTAEQVLDRVQTIEAQLGRDRAAERKAKSESGERYCSRTMDIDILFYGSHRIATARLTVPHPLIAEREFVLVPLAEMWGVSREDILKKL